MLLPWFFRVHDVPARLPVRIGGNGGKQEVLHEALDLEDVHPAPLQHPLLDVGGDQGLLVQAEHLRASAVPSKLRFWIIDQLGERGPSNAVDPGTFSDGTKISFLEILDSNIKTLTHFLSWRHLPPSGF